MIYTKNFKLSKPSYDDDVDVQILNNNMDILDDNLKRTNDKFSQYLPLTGGTMTGSINFPYNDGTYFGVSDGLKLTFHENSYDGTPKGTAGFNCARFMCYFEHNKNIMADDTGIWFSGSKVITDSGTVNSNTTGYTKLSNGLIIQWGVFNDIPASWQINFSTPFTTNCVSVVCNDLENTNKDVIKSFSVYDITTTGFKVLGWRAAGGTPNNFGRYIAIGF